ncbi:MAG: CU044_2847 family protein [Microcystaceae cyanobacterium]
MTKKLYFQTDNGVQDLEINLDASVIPPEENDGIDEMDIRPEKVSQKLDQTQQLIKDYTEYTLKSFKDLAMAEVDEITLKFGIKLGGQAGIPYITQGKVESNIEIEIKCKPSANS